MNIGQRGKMLFTLGVPISSIFSFQDFTVLNDMTFHSKSLSTNIADAISLPRAISLVAMVISTGPPSRYLFSYDNETDKQTV